MTLGGETARVKVLEQVTRLIPPQISRILPEGCYAVGGCVRDTVMGRQPHDVDLTTPVRPDDVVARCKAVGLHVIETGLQHGTVTIMVNGEGYEVTTFRADVETDGRHAKVQYVDNIETDLSRRDFTINAMAMDATGYLIDPFGGQRDIQNRVIRCVGDPHKRFEEDYLRILRGARFAATLGFSIDPETYDAMDDLSPELMERINRGVEGYKTDYLSIERVVEEFNKAFKAQHPSIFLRAMWNLGVVQMMVPEMENADRLEQDPRWHPEGSVWEHTLEVVDRIAPEYRWHGLLHDVGKCLTAQPVEEATHNTFRGHDIAGAGIIEDIGDRLRLPRKLRDSLETSVRMHMAPLQFRTEGKEPPDRVVRRFQREVSDDEHLLALRHLVPADAGHRYDPRADILFERRQDVTPILQGRHLLEVGIKPGPEMGNMLRAAFEHQIQMGETDVEALRQVALNSVPQVPEPPPTTAEACKRMRRVADVMDETEPDVADRIEAAMMRRMETPR